MEQRQSNVGHMVSESPVLTLELITEHFCLCDSPDWFYTYVLNVIITDTLSAF